MGDYWQVTAKMYSSLFEKPKMSEKLLCKPPFKYIFDIISETIKNTGFGKGLLKGEETDSAYYTDKDRKIIYLKKMILLASLVLGEEVDAKANKIVAGVEPEKTNEFLQALYRAAVSGEDSSSYIDKVLRKVGGSSNEEEVKQEEPKQQQQQQERPKKAEAQKPEEKKKEKQAEPEKQKPKEVEQPAPQQTQQNQRVRPSSARRPPTLKENTTVSNDNKQKNENTPSIILEDGSKNDDNDAYVSNIKPQSQSDVGGIEAKEHGQFIRDAMKQSEEQPAPTKKEEEQSTGKIKMTSLNKRTKPTKDDKKPDVIKSIISDAQTGKDGSGAAPDEIEILQKIIQSVTQNTNPLRKSLDFLNDDIESMNKEMEKWRSEYLQSKEKYQSEQRSTEEALQPMMDKLADIDEQIKDKKAKCQSVKSQIIQNNTRIQDLLYSVVTTK